LAIRAAVWASKPISTPPYHGAYEPEGIGDPAGAQHRGGVHQFFGKNHGAANPFDKPVDYCEIPCAAIFAGGAGQGFSDGYGGIGHSPEYRYPLTAPFTDTGDWCTGGHTDHDLILMQGGGDLSHHFLHLAGLYGQQEDAGIPAGGPVVLAGGEAFLPEGSQQREAVTGQGDQGWGIASMINEARAMAWPRLPVPRMARDKGVDSWLMTGRGQKESQRTASPFRAVFLPSRVGQYDSGTDSMLHPLRWLAVAAFFLSLLLPAFEGSALRGYHVLLFGVVGLVDFNPWYGLPWLSNFFLLLSFLLRRGWVRGLVLVLGLGLALPALGIREVPGDGADAMVPVLPGNGLRLWLLAHLLLVMDMVLGRRGNLLHWLGRMP
jgi:hypothetical protein